MSEKKVVGILAKDMCYVLSIFDAVESQVVVAHWPVSVEPSCCVACVCCLPCVCSVPFLLQMRWMRSVVLIPRPGEFWLPVGGPAGNPLK